MGKDKTLTNAYYNEFIDVVYIPALKDYFNNKLSIEAISEKYKNKISHIAHRANKESIRVRTFFAKSEGNLELSFNVINSINHYSEQANIIIDSLSGRIVKSFFYPTNNQDYNDYLNSFKKTWFLYKTTEYGENILSSQLSNLYFSYHSNSSPSESESDFFLFLLCVFKFCSFTSSTARKSSNII